MKNLLVSFWNDEQGFITSIELVFTASIVAIGMIVGLSAYRDGVIEELADNARAVGQVNQSYSVAVAATPAAGITVAGNVVTVSKTFGTLPNSQVTVTSTFNNFSYTDTADFCENAPLQRVSAAAATESDTAQPPTP